MKQNKESQKQQLTSLPVIPLAKLNCHHCTLWHKDCTGITYNGLDKTGDTYCISIWQNFSEETVDGIESKWLESIA